MPLTGKLLSSGKTVYIWKLDDPRAEIEKGDLVCRLCEGQMGVRQGLVRAWHFFHYASCTSALEQHPESADHIAAKHRLLMFMAEQFRDSLKSAKVEEPIPEANRVADVLLTFKTGWRVAHEVQLSSITTGELEARTRDYADAGVDVYWWLGKQGNTPVNRQWCLDEMGQVGDLVFGVEAEHLCLEGGRR